MEDAVGERVERITSEGTISMKDAAAIYGVGVHKSTPSRHAIKGILVNGARVKLESIRVGGKIVTSRAAVLRFLAAQNGAPAMTISVTPAVRKRAASKASAAVAELLRAA